VDIRVKGAEQLAALAKDLRAADKDIKREFSKEMRAAGKPAGEAVRAAYGQRLPQRGGLAARARRSAISVQVRSSGTSIGAKLKLRNAYSLWAMESGRLRHPVYRTGKWAEQAIPPNIGTEAFEKQAPMVQRRMLDALDAVANKITRG
jgi:hypothetical protein